MSRRGNCWDTQSLLMMLTVQIESVDMQINVGVDIGKLSLDFCVLLDKDTGEKITKRFMNQKTTSKRVLLG